MAIISYTSKKKLTLLEHTHGEWAEYIMMGALICKH